MRERKENYESFCRRLRPILSHRDLMFVEVAYVLAKHGHRAQFRKGEIDPDTGKPVRYFEHPRRVTLILIDVLHCVEPTVLQAALLHDGVEDTRLLRPAFIETVFGQRVASIVKMLSKVPKRGYLARLIAYGDWRVLLIKCCDRLDNMRTIDRSPDWFKRKQATETREKYYEVLDLMVRKVPARYKEGARSVRDEIHGIVERLERELAAPKTGRKDRKAPKKKHPRKSG